MSALSQAIDDLFADPNFAAKAVYLPESVDPISVRVFARRPDRVLKFDDTRAARMFHCYAKCNSLFSQRNSLFRFLGNSEGTP